MGIKRCPYCRALVEEGEVYCRHCGTQLLFPEDEQIEEDIPGEKIGLEEESEEEITEVPAGEEEITEEIEFEEEIAATTEDRETAAEERGGEEAGEEAEEEAAPEQAEETKEEEMKPKRPDRDETEEETEEIGIKEDKEEEETEYLGGILDEPEAEDAREKPSLEEEEASELEPGIEELRKSLRFPTEELNRITRSVDEAKKEVEEFLLYLKERAEKKKLETPGEEEMTAPAEAGEEMAEERKAGKSETAEGSQLPPWAEAIRDRVETEPDALTDLSSVAPRGISFEDKISDEERESAAPREKFTPSWEELVTGERERKPWQADSGVGLPERPGQQPLPFEVARREEETMSWQDKEAEETEERAFDRQKPLRKSASWDEAEETQEAVKRADEEAQEEEAGEEFGERPVARSFKSWLKARLFDLIFIGLIWMITFVLAARVAASSFFNLLTASALQAGALFLIFFLGYLFLFRFFIGETLGDRLFSSSD